MRLLIDECLSVTLVAVAKKRGIAAEHVAHLGKSGWQDWNLVPFALENDYVVVTNNRRHFLREYAKAELHNGLIVILPAVDRTTQQRLFDRALDVLAAQNSDFVNKLVEVFLDGSVHIRDWTSGDHDVGHISNPKRG